MNDSKVAEALLGLAPLADTIERLAILSGEIDPQEIEKTVPEMTDELREMVEN